MPLIVIKLGGSVITYKNSRTPKPRIKVIKRLTNEILSLHKNKYQILLVHGGGSYGHNLAKKYKLTSGLINRNSIIGLAKTLQSMSKLNSIIMAILEQAGLPAVSFSPHSFMTQTNGKLLGFETSVIEKILESGYIPVLYGDGVIDETLGCSIVSGDSIATFLAKKLGAEKLIFLSDVDGIFDDNPFKNKAAKLIKHINDKNFDQVLMSIKQNNNNDITGEMQGKILSIKENLHGKQVLIVNGFVEGNLSKGVRGQTVGTVIHF